MVKDGVGLVKFIYLYTLSSFYLPLAMEFISFFAKRKKKKKERERLASFTISTSQSTKQTLLCDIDFNVSDTRSVVKNSTKSRR